MTQGQSPGPVARPDALGRLFSACCEYAFEAELGVVDPPLVDYMSGLLLRFVRADAAATYRDPEGRRLGRLTELLLEAERREGRSLRDLRQHIGDVTLFWTGVYPESLPKLLSVDSSECLIDVPSQGRRCYRLASEFGDEQSPILARIADEYETCREGLRLARRVWNEG